MSCGFPPSATPIDGAPFGTAIHATAVAINGRALAITGTSRSGKSTLAAALLAASTPRRRVALIGDDRVLLVRRRGEIIVRPHPRVAGFMERRGLGIVAVDYRREAPLLGRVDLGTATSRQALPPNLPFLVLEHCGTVERRLDLVFEWWASITLRQTEHSSLGKRC